MGDRVNAELHMCGVVKEEDLSHLIDAMMKEGHHNNRDQCLAEIKRGTIDFDDVNYGQMENVEGLVEALALLDESVSYIWACGKGWGFPACYEIWDAQTQTYLDGFYCDPDGSLVFTLDEFDNNPDWIERGRKGEALYKHIHMSEMKVTPKPPKPLTGGALVWALANLPTTNGATQ